MSKAATKKQTNRISVDTTTNAVTTLGNKIPDGHQKTINEIKQFLGDSLDKNRWHDYDIYQVLQRNSYNPERTVEAMANSTNEPNQWNTVAKKKPKAKQDYSYTQTRPSNGGSDYRNDRGTGSRHRNAHSRESGNRQPSKGNRSNDRYDNNRQGRYNNSNNYRSGGSVRGNRDNGRDSGRGNRGRGDYRANNDRRNNRTNQGRSQRDNKDRRDDRREDRRDDNRRADERRDDKRDEGRDSGRNNRPKGRGANGPRSRKSGGPRQNAGGAPARSNGNTGARSNANKGRNAPKQAWLPKQDTKQAAEIPEEPKQPQFTEQPAGTPEVQQEPKQEEAPPVQTPTQPEPTPHTEPEPLPEPVNTAASRSLLPPGLDNYDDDDGLSFGSFGAPRGGAPVQTQPQVLLHKKENEPELEQRANELEAQNINQQAPQQQQPQTVEEKDIIQPQQAPAPQQRVKQENVQQQPPQQQPNTQHPQMAGPPGSLPPNQLGMGQPIRGPYYQGGMPPPNFQMRYRAGYHEDARFFEQQHNLPGQSHPSSMPHPNNGPHPNLNHPNNFQDSQNNFEQRGASQDKFNANSTDGSHQQEGQPSASPQQQGMPYGNLHGGQGMPGMPQSQYGQNMGFPGYPPYMNNHYGGYHPAQPGNYPPFQRVFTPFHGGPKHNAGYGNNFGPPSGIAGPSGSPGPAQGMAGNHGSNPPPAGYQQGTMDARNARAYGGQPGDEEYPAVKGNAPYGGAYNNPGPPPGMDAREPAGNTNTQQGGKPNPRNGAHMQSNEVIGQFNGDRSQQYGSSDQYSFYGTGQPPFQMQPNMMMYGGPSPHSSPKVYTANQQGNHYASK